MSTRRIPALLRRGGRSPVVSGGGAWTPADLADLRGWYRSDLGVTLDTGAVQTWADQSGNGNDLAAASAGARPGFVATGYNGTTQPYLTFNGTTQWLRRTVFSWGGVAGPHTIVFIGKRQTATQNLFLVDYGAAFVPYIRTASSSRIEGRSSSVAGGLTQTNDSPNDVQSIYGLWWDGATRRVYRDYYIANSVVDAGTATADGQGFSVGAATSGLALAACDVVEVIVVRRALTADEWKTLALYAERYWNLVGTADVLCMGQSNAQGFAATTETVKVPRPDIFAARDTEFASVREQSAGEMSWTRTSGGNVQGYDTTVAANLKLLSRRGRILNTAKAGTGFFLASGAGVDPAGWGSSTITGGAPGTVYQRALDMIATYGSPMADLTPMIWSHGETDGESVAGATAYEANLNAFFTDLEADTGRTIAPIILRLHTGASVAEKATIRAAQAAFVAGWPGATLLDLDSYTLQPDLLHYSSAMHASIGAACATIIDGLLP